MIASTTERPANFVFRQGDNPIVIHSLRPRYKSSFTHRIDAHRDEKTLR